MATLTGSTIAGTYDQLVKRQDSYSQTGSNIEIMEDDGTIQATGLYLEGGGGKNVGINEAVPIAALSVGTGSDTLVAAPTDGEDVSIAGINLVIADSGDYCMGIQNTSPSGNGLLIKAGDHVTTDWALRVVDYNGGTEGLCVTGGGRVGIGTFAPEAQLHVYGGDSGQTVHSQADSFIIESKSDPMGMSFLSDDGEQVNIYFGDTSDNDVGKIIYDHADNSLAFWTNAAERMVIENDGAVGIGTTAPQYLLQISETDGTGKLAITRGDTDGVSAAVDIGEIYFGVSADDTDPRAGAKITATTAEVWSNGGTDNGTDLEFYTCDEGDATLDLRMIIQDDGNVGIGVAAPLKTFHVQSADIDRATALFTHPSSTDGNVLGVSVDFSGADPDDETQWFLYCQDSAATRYVIYSSGDSWSVDGGAVNSDERLKENIVDATSKLDDINKLKVRNFNFRQTDKDTGQKIHGAGAASRKRIGFIAQEFEEIFPSLVRENELISAREAVEAKDAVLDSDGNVLEEAIKAVTARDQLIRKNLKVDALIPMLVKSIQELSAKVTALENA